MCHSFRLAPSLRAVSHSHSFNVSAEAAGLTLTCCPVCYDADISTISHPLLPFPVSIRPLSGASVHLIDVLT